MEGWFDSIRLPETYYLRRDLDYNATNPIPTKVFGESLEHLVEKGGQLGRLYQGILTQLEKYSRLNATNPSEDLLLSKVRNLFLRDQTLRKTLGYVKKL